MDNKKQQEEKQYSTNQETKPTQTSMAEQQKQEIQDNIKNLEQELNKTQNTQCTTLKKIQQNFIQTILQREKAKLTNYEN